jgi:UDP-N-acetylmuramate dehydrogenase
MEILKKIEKNRSLKMLSTLGVGGEASYYLRVNTIEEMRGALQFGHLNQIPFFILGRGSNCLFDDAGFEGLVIHNQIDFFEEEKENLRVGSGLSFSWLGRRCVRNHLSGLEFASGIPGTIGGAIYMNAAAHGQEISSVLREVLFLSENGEEKNFSLSEILFSYRYSSFQQMKGAIVSALFSLTPSLDSVEKERNFLAHRRQTQPLNTKNAGCVFRNPNKEVSAGSLIEKSGLKGFAIGDARVSEKHANFIINEGNATSKDVLALILHVQSTVLEKFGYLLEKEICILPPKEESNGLSGRSPLS